MQVQSFSVDEGHTQKIESLAYNQLVNRETNSPLMAGSVLSCSEDRTLKVWDRGSGKVAINMSFRNKSIFSVDTNRNVIVAGTKEDVVFWDVRNTKVPMEILDESHSDDVTAVKFNPMDSQKMVSCGMDQLLNYYDFEGK